MAAFLCALVSWVALALEGAFCIDAVAVSTQPDVLTLINVCLGEGKTCNLSKSATHNFLNDSSLHLQHQIAIKSLICNL